MAQPEDVFCVVVDVLDDIFDTSHPTQEYVDELWTNVLNEIRGWKNDASKHDKMLTAGTVFYIVRDLLGYHWEHRYSETFYDMMSVTLERELKVEDKEEEKRFLNRLLDCSTELSNWINNYDPCNGFLSESIEDVVNGKVKIKVIEPVVNNAPILTSFTYFPKGMEIEERNRRLVSFFEALAKNGKFIYPKKDLDHKENVTNQQDFLNAFIGMDTDKKIVWTNEEKRLNYLIHKLKQLKLISWNAKPKHGILQMICARFLIRKKIYEDVEGKLKKDWHWEECEITPANLNAKMDNDDSELDLIIDELKPDAMKQAIAESIETGVAGVFSEEQKDALSTDEQEMEGFHPTDHQSYLQS